MNVPDSKLSQSATKRIDVYRDKQTFIIARQIILFLAFPTAFLGHYANIFAFGDIPEVYLWIAFFAPTCFFLWLSYRLNFIRRHPQIPVLLGAWYVAIEHFHLALISSKPTSNVYDPHIETMFAVAMIPMTTFWYCTITIPIFVGYFAIMIWKDGSFFNYINSGQFAQARTYIILIYVGFYFTNRLRNQFYQKTIELEDELEHRENIIKKQVSEISKSRIAVAIANTTQMLAHDVRKPFNMIRSGMKMISNSPTMEEVRRVISILAPQLDKALISVNGMIREIGSAGKAHVSGPRNSQNIKELIDLALHQVFCDRESADVIFDYKLNFTGEVFVETGRVDRVFVNILSNGAEAINYNGRIWFETEDLGEMVRVTIGNSDSSIPQEILAVIFEPYVASNKIGGTGLGLSISAQIVRDHGGTISCESIEGKGVEFTFTLPRSIDQKSQDTRALPTSAKQVYKEMRTFDRSGQKKEDTAAGPFDGKVPIIIVEDSDFVHMAWTYQIKDHSLFRLFHCPEDFLSFAEAHPEVYTTTKYFLFDFDYDHRSKMDGAMLAKIVRDKTKSKIFLYSEVELETLPTYFDGQLEKRCFTLEELAQS